MNALVPRQTVEQICSFRDEALRRFEIACGKIEDADASIKEAYALWDAAAPGKPGFYENMNDEVKSLSNAVRMPNRDLYLRTAKRLVDVTVWTHVIQHAGIETLMDRQAKDELRAQMRYVPEQRGRNGELINEEEIARLLPEVTPENIYATLERFQEDAEIIFRRGIVNVFAKLDRRFRSHDGFKVGSRMILDRIADSSGYLSSHGAQTERLMDVERTFRVLDGKADHAGYGGIVAQIGRERTNWKPAQSEHESDYFKVRIFKNGNAHLWFTRDDLVVKVNQILADHYGEVIGDGMAQEADPLKNIKTTPAKRYGFYPTPETAAAAAISYANLLQPRDRDRLRILEPSAGTGNLARRCLSPSLESLNDWQRERYGKECRLDNAVDCIEVQPHLATELEAEGIYNRVTCADFLQVNPDPARLYDIVMMNPPFDRERDIDHVMHALSFLKPSGTLIAIMSAGTEFRQTKKSAAFRDVMESMGAEWNDLPAGSFADVGTYVNTGILKVKNDGKKSDSRWGRPTWEKF